MQVAGQRMRIHRQGYHHGLSARITRVAHQQCFSRCLSSAHHTLGVTPDASEKEVKAAFRRLALRWHPDRPGGCVLRFREVQRAHDQMRSHALGSQSAPANETKEEEEDDDFPFWKADTEEAGPKSEEEREREEAEHARRWTMWGRIIVGKVVLCFLFFKLMPTEREFVARRQAAERALAGPGRLASPSAQLRGYAPAGREAELSSGDGSQSAQKLSRDSRRDF